MKLSIKFLPISIFLLYYNHYYVYGRDFSHGFPPNFQEAVAEGSVVFDMVLDHSLITRLTDLSFYDCLTECEIRPRCKSVNYFQNFQLCEPNYNGDRNSELKSVTGGAIFTTIESWKSEKDKCREDQDLTEILKKKCIVDETGGYTYVTSDCGVPQMRNGKVDLQNGIGVYSKAMFLCNVGFIPSGKSKISCQQNGEWSTTDFRCNKICGAGKEPKGDICNDCDIGTYSNTTDTNKCIECPDNQYQDEEGQTSCKTCTAEDNPCGEVKTLYNTNVAVETYNRRRQCIATYSCLSGKDQFLDTSKLFILCRNFWDEPRLNCINDPVLEKDEDIYECPSLPHNDAMVQTNGYLYGYYWFTRNNRVYCDVIYDGGKWMIIQQRLSSIEHDVFNQTWQEYKEGFSTTGADYWIGNTFLHTLTSSTNYELAILLWIQYGQSLRQLVARYGTFTVGNEQSKFKISVDKYTPGNSTLGNRFGQIDGQPFSTWDDDTTDANCAIETGTGWWFRKNVGTKTDCCYHGNVNALSWWDRAICDRTRMMIRPASTSTDPM